MMDGRRKIEIVEVGPRDGFQNIDGFIDTEVKIQATLSLLESGVDFIEAGSFISPKAIPQMRDAAQVCTRVLETAPANKVFALVPNAKGAARAAEAGVKALTMVISASAEHNMSNVRKSPEESLKELRTICSWFPHMHIKLDVATAFGCPFKGEVTIGEIRKLMDGALELGIRDICLCDTIGVANPLQVKHLLDTLLSSYSSRGLSLSLHLHNTRGLAAANTVAAIDLGISRFETAVAGLGGCPFAPGASGNMSTEDMIYLCSELGYETNADLDKVLAVTAYLKGAIGCCADSKINEVTRHKVFKERRV